MVRRLSIGGFATVVCVVVSCVLALPVLAAGEAPSVDSESASSITPFKALLEAQVNPHEEATTSCVFEYGTTVAYGTSVPCEQGPLEGGEDQLASASVSELEPSTTYHFRIVVENATGPTAGADSELTTPAAQAPIVDGESVSGITPFDATLEAQVNPDDQETSFFFEYALDEALSGATIVPGPGPLFGFGDQTASAAIAGLEHGTTYFYRVVAKNAIGETQGAVQSFTTIGLPTVDDIPPTATNITHRSARLSGTVNPGGIPTTYHFEYGTSETYGSSTPTAPAGEGTEDVSVGPQAISELQPGTTYHYRLTATSAAGTSHGADHTFTTAPPLAPIVTTGAAGGVSSRTATISGTVDPQGLPTSYEFDLGIDTSYGTPIFGNAGAGTAETVQLALSNLTPGATYHYRLCASNEDGTTCGADQTFTTPGFAFQLVGGSSAPLIAFPAAVLKELAAAEPHGSSTTPAKPLTRAQKLKKALKACGRKPRRKRAACRHAAKRRFR